ncbi:MAG: hypothetical protein EOP56_18770 [Sphingobacteriales bacterium]|nr:MAG: hypothetical protein EOP56_18770 [Sphingobacteriales bacterium]
MKYLSAICIFAAICLGGNVAVRAQGDSDPGFSTIGAMRSMPDLMIADDEFEVQRMHIGVGNTFTKGDQDTKIYIPALEIRVPWQDYGYFDLQLPYYVAVGDIASVSGIGDLSFAYTHEIRPEYFPDWSYQITGGFKIGMGTADLQDTKTRSLPMVYQSNSGTTDFIIGGHIKYKQYFVVSAAYQQPFVYYNENGYNRLALENDFVYNNPAYPMARKLRRYGDVMVRAEGILTGKRAGVSAGPLAFYHLHDDMYTDRQNREIQINGSAGFTLNAFASAFVRMGRKAEWKLDVTASAPLIQRDAIPDGLRRDWVVTPRITYFFGQRTLLW